MCGMLVVISGLRDVYGRVYPVASSAPAGKVEGSPSNRPASGEGTALTATADPSAPSRKKAAGLPSTPPACRQTGPPANGGQAWADSRMTEGLASRPDEEPRVRSLDSGGVHRTPKTGGAKSGDGAVADACLRPEA